MKPIRPVLLLLPGMLNTPAVWADVAELLRPQADVRMADFGTQSSIPEMAGDAWAAVADVPLDTALVVCGFSMGGYVALEMLAQAQRPLNGLGLLNTSAQPETAQTALGREKTIAALERDFAKVVHKVALLAVHPDRQTDGMLMERTRQIMSDTGAPAAIRQNRAILARGDHRALLAQLKLPVRVISSRDDQVVPPAHSEALAALIPGARLVWVAHAGHMTPLEQPQAVADVLRGLLS